MILIAIASNFDLAIYKFLINSLRLKLIYFFIIINSRTTTFYGACFGYYVMGYASIK